MTPVQTVVMTPNLRADASRRRFGERERPIGLVES
jgi:hypothetical protein